MVIHKKPPGPATWWFGWLISDPVKNGSMPPLDWDSPSVSMSGSVEGDDDRG